MFIVILQLRTYTCENKKLMVFAGFFAARGIFRSEFPDVFIFIGRSQ